MSWKTGDVTCVSDVIAFLSSHPHRTDETPKLREFIDLESGTGHKPSVIDPDDSLIALVDGPKNRLEICKLVLQSHRPHLQTLCYLELPQLKPNIHYIISRAEKEWVATSRNQDFSPSSRRRLVPFRSCKIGSLHLPLSCMHAPLGDPVYAYGIIVSVAALLSVARSYYGDVRTIPWVGWGPSATHIFPFGWSVDKPIRRRMTTPAGPFWIMEDTQLGLVIQDYDWLRNRQMQATVENTSSLSRPTVTTAKEIGRHWVAGAVETHLPHRDVVTIESRDWFMSRYDPKVLIDREWFIRISRGVSI